MLLLSLVQGTSPTGIVGIVTTLPFTLCVYVITTATKIGDRKTDGISVPRICISLRVYSSLFYLLRLLLRMLQYHYCPCPNPYS